VSGSGSNDTDPGIRVAASTDADPLVALRNIRSQFGAVDQIGHLLVFFPASFNPNTLLGALAEVFPGTPYSGCSTAGEIGPHGISEGGLVVVAFARSGFTVCCEVIQDIKRFGVERATNVARSLYARVANDPDSSEVLRDRLFALLLVDGVSKVEEMLVAAIDWAMGDIELVGGSAGDGLKFCETILIQNGRAYTNSAILMLVESAYPFRTFKTQNFEPTSTKLVVTAADPEHRIIYELNAEPAATEYAEAIGLMSDELGPFSFASYPLVVKIGDEYYCRSIRQMNEDGSLTFFCAIDEGLVFTVARPTDMVLSTKNTLEELDRQLGGLQVVLGFDCILRRLDAENRQIVHQLEETYRKSRLVGFHTYGEQYKSMHLNQTLTGIAFGMRPARSVSNGQDRHAS